MKRHDLAYLHLGQRFWLLDGRSDEVVENYLRQMIRQGVPFTVCRQNMPTITKLATSCLIDGVKSRVSLAIEGDPKAITAPLSLTKIGVSRLISVQSLIDEFVRDCQALTAEVYVYGSYAGEYLTGLNFVTDGSDLDVLIVLKDKTHWLDLLAVIRQFQDDIVRKVGIDVDGEIRVGDDDVSFNELTRCMQEGIDTVVVKNIKEITLKSMDEIFKRRD